MLGSSLQYILPGEIAMYIRMITKRLNNPNDWRCPRCKHFNRPRWTACRHRAHTPSRRVTRPEIAKRKRVRAAGYLVEAALRKFGLLNAQQGIR